MKILYAIQGTGNGHLSRARDIIPILQRKGEVDILISGTQADVHLPFEIKYRFNGMSFVFGQQGGIDLWETYKKNKLRNLFNEINQLPVDEYDLVINDFEPVSAWACYIKNKDCIALSHQAAVLNKRSPKPDVMDMIGKSILKSYAPATTKYGFHFQAYDKNIFTPVIRKEIRELQSENQGHYTVYLPAYSDKRIINILSEFTDVKWHVFSKHSTGKCKEKNISVFPINNLEFMESMGGAAGILCGAGFETPAEAMYLGKKLLVIPMKQQIEQHCNAAALKTMGIAVIKSLNKKNAGRIKSWLDAGVTISINYPDNTEEIIDLLISRHLAASRKTYTLGKKAYTVKDFRKLSLKKIILQLAS